MSARVRNQVVRAYVRGSISMRGIFVGKRPSGKRVYFVRDPDARRKLAKLVRESRWFVNEQVQEGFDR